MFFTTFSIESNSRVWLKLLEVINGLLGVEMGHISLGSPFEPINPVKIGDILE